MENQADLKIEIDVNVSPATAYQAISEVRNWWTRDTVGESSHLGDEFTVRFKETFVSFRVAKADAPVRWVWHVTECCLHWIEDKTEWKGTELEWFVEARGEGSHLVMVHRGVSPRSECYDDCKAGWEHFVKSSLSKLITEGVGLPEGGGVHA